jgi:hypothetical protein
VTTPPITADGSTCAPVRASGATFVVVSPRTDGSPEPVEPPPVGAAPACVVVVVLEKDDDEDDDDDELKLDDELDDELDDDEEEVVVVDWLPVAQISPFGSEALAVNVTTTFQNLSP